MSTSHQPVTSSGLKTSGGQTVASGCYLHDVLLISDGTNVATLIVYEGTSTSGVVLAKMSIPATTAAPQVISFNQPISANTGIFTAVTGTGAGFIIYYSAGI